jgi:hypothetical protein
MLIGCAQTYERWIDFVLYQFCRSFLEVAGGDSATVLALRFPMPNHPLTQPNRPAIKPRP